MRGHKMLVKRKFYLNIVIQTLYWFALLTALIIVFSTIFPDSDAFLTIKYILFSLPRYWFIFFCLLISTQWRRLNTFNRYALPFILVTSFYYLDFQVNINLNEQNKENSHSYTLVSINLGEGVELNRLASLIRFYQPDILTLQESADFNNSKVFKDYPFKDCRGNLCFISKYEFKMVNFLSHSIFNGYGNWAVFYEVNINSTKVNVANVHLPTVRNAFNNFSRFDDVHSSRALSSSILNEWASLNKNVIIAGDFNMTVTDNLYRRNFIEYQNAITDYGVGFNNTFDYI